MLLEELPAEHLVDQPGELQEGLLAEGVRLKAVLALQAVPVAPGADHGHQAALVEGLLHQEDQEGALWRQVDPGVVVNS